MSRQAVLGELPVNDNSDPTGKGRRLNFSCATSDEVAAHLKLEDALGGEPIRIPLTRKMTPVRNENIPEEWATILTPARFCRKLNIDVQPHHPRDAKPKKFTRLNNDNWLYIYVNGCLWRELQIERHRSATYYKDVNLEHYEEHENQDNRIASGQRVNRVVLPIKLENKEVTVEVAYSDIQWSWARVQSLGGIAPEGVKRKVWFPDEHPVNPKGKDLRNDRMQTLPLLKGYANAFSQTVGDVIPIEECNLYEFRLDDGKKFPFIALNNYIQDALDLAQSHQQSWLDMENYIAEISNPNNVDKHPLSPWFDSAVLANQYFFVEHPDVLAENLPNTVNQPVACTTDETKAKERKKLEKAKKQREKWKSKLSLEDIQSALGTKERSNLRGEIITRKNYLANFLDESNPNLKYFIAALDDFITRPPVDENKPDDPFDAACVYELSDAICARLGDYIYSLDLAYETTPPDAKMEASLKENDSGRRLLRKIANVKSQHPLAVRLFPQVASSDNSMEVTHIVDDDPKFQNGRYANATRRSVHLISSFTQHFYSVATELIDDTTKKGVIGLINESGAGFKIEEMEVKLGDIINGKLSDPELEAKGYFILSAEVISTDKKLNRKEAAKYDSGGVAVNDKAYAPINIKDKNGKLIASTSMEAHKNGSSLSSRQWRFKRHNTDYLETKLKISIAKKLKGAKSLSRWAVDKKVWSGGILPLVGFVELYNVYTAFSVLNKSKSTLDENLARHQLLSAMVDLASISANIYEFRENIIHNKTKPNLNPVELELKNAKLIRLGIVVKGIGAGAGIYSAFVNHHEIINDINQGDDAAIAKNVMQAGFVFVTFAEVVGIGSYIGGSATLVAMGAMSGPLLIIGLAILVIGAILLTWVFTEDTPLEEWLAAGPFTKQPLPKRSNGSAPEHQYHVLKEGTTEIRIDMNDIVMDVVELGGRQAVYKDSRGVIYKTENDQDRVVGVIGGKLNRNDFPKHSPRFARFDPKTDEINSKFHLWKLFPGSAARALHSALMTPTAHIKIEPKSGAKRIPMSSPSAYDVTVEMFIPNYIDNVTKVFVKIRSRGNYSTKKGDWIWNQVLKDISITTGEGSGPRHVIYNAISDAANVKAEIYVDLYGDGRIMLPSVENSWTEQMEMLRQQNPNKILVNYDNTQNGLQPMVIEARYDTSQDISPVL